MFRFLQQVADTTRNHGPQTLGARLLQRYGRAGAGLRGSGGPLQKPESADWFQHRVHRRDGGHPLVGWATGRVTSRGLLSTDLFMRTALRHLLYAGRVSDIFQEC